MTAEADMAPPATRQPIELAEPRVDVINRPDGTILVRSARELPPYPRQLGDHLRRWAQEAPDRTFLAERDEQGGWRRLSFAAARHQADALASALLARGHGAERPVMALGDNSIALAVLILACMQIGVPVMPVSPAYSLMSQSFDKLKAIAATFRPSLIHAPKIAPFAKALAALPLDGVEILCDAADPLRPDASTLRDYLATTPGEALERAYAAVDPDQPVKILLTSGSTGAPKGVINTHRMMIASGAGTDQLWPFLGARPPVLVDWLPWNHTFGANFSFNQILRHGGTMYIDGGRPAPGRIDVTVRNLREISPTLLYNVPRGYDMLIGHLEADEALTRNVFADLDVVFYAGAALPQALFDRLDALARRATGRRVPLLSALGSTETAPVATLGHWLTDRTGSIGLPISGTELKLVPNGGKLELRVRGPGVTPGYYRDAQKTEEAFDEEGFFKIGDALRFADPARPELGLLFDGRVAENFKLMSGTWVHVGNLRLALISACAPIVQDAVIAGEGRDEIGALLFANADSCRRLVQAAPADEPLAALLARPEVTRHLEQALARHNAANSGSSMAVRRAAWLLAPPSIDRSEITDKGYINQRALLANRAALVEQLYAAPPGIVPLVPQSGRSESPR
jgi:feruloyl-CoA synthase